MATVESLDDKVIIDQVLAARRESFESRRSKDGWARRAWDWYNNVHDFTDKEDWQTKLAIPNFAMAVDQAENFMRDGLRKSTRLFGIEVLNDDPIDKLLAAFLGTVMHEIIRVIELKKQLPGSMKVALLTNQSIHKIGYEEFSQTKSSEAPNIEISFQTPIPIKNAKQNSGFLLIYLKDEWDFVALAKKEELVKKLFQEIKTMGYGQMILHNSLGGLVATASKGQEIEFY